MDPSSTPGLMAAGRREKRRGITKGWMNEQHESVSYAIMISLKAEHPKLLISVRMKGAVFLGSE